MERLPVSREAVERLLACKPTRRQLKWRYGAVSRLRADVVRLVGWPALADSLLEDMGRIFDRMGKNEA